jgi:peptidoglycan/LPS O-acetylase OafA/YrhL
MGATRGNSNWFVLGDPLRGLAAFGVLVFHVAALAVLQGTRPTDVATLGFAGRILFNLDAGVFLFFLLSGYLIGRPFASAFVLQTPFPQLGRYVARRILRLAPGLLAATVLAVAAFGIHFTRGTVHFWTLGAEACFYAGLPLAGLAALPLARRLRGPRSRAAAWTGACALVALGSLWFRARGTPTGFTHQHLFPSVAFAFAPGLAMAALEPLAAPVIRARPSVATNAARLSMAVAAAGATAYFAVPRERFMLHSVLAVAASAALLAAALLREWGELPPWRLVDNRPLQWLGERSYSLYLFHFTVVVVAAQKLKGVGTPSARVALVGLLAVPFSLILAWIGYALVERPFIRERRISAESSATPAGRVLSPS